MKEAYLKYLEVLYSTKADATLTTDQREAKVKIAYAKYKKIEEEIEAKEFDSESFINELEELNGVEESPLAYEDYEEQQYSQMSERDLRGAI